MNKENIDIIQIPTVKTINGYICLYDHCNPDNIIDKIPYFEGINTEVIKRDLLDKHSHRFRNNR